MTPIPAVGTREVAASRRPPVPTRPRRAAGALTWPAARAVAARAVSRLGSQTVALDHALGHRLSCDLIAITDLPVVDVSAMDGWAGRGPGPWGVVAGVSEGIAVGRLDAGQCQDVATGAPVPHGADAVLPVEHSLLSSPDAAVVEVRAGVRLQAGQHIRRAGEEATR